MSEGGVRWCLDEEGLRQRGTCPKIGKKSGQWFLVSNRNIVGLRLLTLSSVGKSVGEDCRNMRLVMTTSQSQHFTFLKTHMLDRKILSIVCLLKFISYYSANLCLVGLFQSSSHSMACGLLG